MARKGAVWARKCTADGCPTRILLASTSTSGCFVSNNKVVLCGKSPQLFQIGSFTVALNTSETNLGDRDDTGEAGL